MTVERHRDLFPPECPDELWLQYVGENGRIAITHDRRIRYKPNELAAVRRHRVALRVVVGKVPFPQLAQNLVATMPRISAFLGQHAAPFVAKIYRPSPSEIAKDPGSMGSVSLWYPK